jgi:hypothetical protein
MARNTKAKVKNTRRRSTKNSRRAAPRRKSKSKSTLPPRRKRTKSNFVAHTASLPAPSVEAYVLARDAATRATAKELRAAEVSADLTPVNTAAPLNGIEVPQSKQADDDALTDDEDENGNKVKVTKRFKRIKTNMKMAVVGVGAAYIGAKMYQSHKKEQAARAAAKKEALRLEKRKKVKRLAASKEFSPIFAQNDVLCSPVYHPDHKSFYKDEYNAYWCVPDTGESGYDWNFTDTVRSKPGEVKPGSGDPSVKWVLMPHGWKPYNKDVGFWATDHHEDSLIGQPKVEYNLRHMSMVKNYSTKDQQGNFELIPRLYVTDAVKRKGQGTVNPTPVACIPSSRIVRIDVGDTTPNHIPLTREQAGGQETAYYCRVNDSPNKDSHVGDRFAPNTVDDTAAQNNKGFSLPMSDGTFEHYIMMPPHWSPFDIHVGQDASDKFDYRLQEDGEMRWMASDTTSDLDAYRYGTHNPQDRALLVQEMTYMCPKDTADCADQAKLYCDMDGEFVEASEASGWITFRERIYEGCDVAGQPENSLARLTANKTAPGQFKKGKLHRKESQ